MCESLYHSWPRKYRPSVVLHPVVLDDIKDGVDTTTSVFLSVLLYDSTFPPTGKSAVAVEWCLVATSGPRY